MDFTKIAVMVDYKNRKEDLAKIESIDLIRVAFHMEDYIEALKYCKYLKDIGYKVSANAMITSRYSEKEIKELASLSTKYRIDYLYIADSLGNISLNNIDRINHLLTMNYDGKIGFHGHDNSGRALLNMEYLLSKNKDIIIDSCINGMGRGAGNLKTENLLIHLRQNHQYKISVESIISILILIDIEKAVYILTALINVHPNYGSLILEKNLSLEKGYSILKLLKGKDKYVFDRESFNKYVT